MRRQWMPVLARVYHVPPADQSALTLEQFSLIRADYERQIAEEEG